MINKWLTKHLSITAINISWLLLGRIYYLIINTISSVFIVRYLGPDNNGIYSYVIAFASLFSGLSIMGLDNILIKEFCNPHKSRKDLIKASFIIRGIGTGFAFLIMLIVMHIMNLDLTIQIYILISGITLFFNAISSVSSWFYSKSNANFIVIAQSIVYSISFIVKIFLILINCSLFYFIIVYVAETALTILYEWVIFVQKEGKLYIKEKSVSVSKELHNLFLQGWPIIFGSVANMIYLKSDQIMIGEMLNNYELGIYSVAVKLAEVWYFVPSAIATAVMPHLTKLKSTNESAFENCLQKYMSIFVGFGYFIGIVTSIFSKPIILLLYGREYSAAAPILCVYIWAGIFINMSILRGQYYVIMEITEYSMWTNLIGAISNIILNLVLIPILGGIGAAIATCISYALYAYISSFFFPKLHKIGKIETQSLFLKGVKIKSNG